MVFHMKTTFVIDDHLMAEIQQEAVRRGKTTSEVVESALRSFLWPAPQGKDLPSLPTFKGGDLLIDICDQDKLHDIPDES